MFLVLKTRAPALKFIIGEDLMPVACSASETQSFDSTKRGDDCGFPTTVDCFVCLVERTLREERRGWIGRKWNVDEKISRKFYRSSDWRVQEEASLGGIVDDDIFVELHNLSRAT